MCHAEVEHVSIVLTIVVHLRGRSDLSERRLRDIRALIAESGGALPACRTM